MQCACAILSSVACPAVEYFSTLSHKGTIFGGGEEGGNILNTKCVFSTSVQLFSETFFILIRTDRDMIRNVYWTSCNIPVILVTF